MALVKSYQTYVTAVMAFASVWVVPAAVLLAFGDRPEPPVIAPDASLSSSVVSSSSVAPGCVMFCEPTPVMAPATAAPTTSAEPDCFMCGEPPLPSGTELCRLFCELGPWG